MSIFALLTMGMPAYAATQGRPVVLELFTSQGCSSCPPADALFRQFSIEEPVIALSYHVHYWDYLGWKDHYASEQNTQRQQRYAQAGGRSGVFTPELIVDGVQSTVGSDASAVSSALVSARQDKVSVPIVLSADSKNKTLNVEVGVLEKSLPEAEILAIRFIPNSTTDVKAGENGGRTLSSINSVTEVLSLGMWNNKASHFQLPLHAGEGVAILVQNKQQGRIIGAIMYKGVL